MKKYIALLLAALLLFGLCACGGKEEPSISNNVPEAPAEPQEPAKTPESTPEPAAESGTLMEFGMVNFRYDEELWVIDEDYTWDDDYSCSVEMWIPDPADPEEDLVYLDMYLDSDSTLDFRSSLVYAGLSIEDYARGAIETVNVGGQELIPYGDGEDTMYYMGRVENAGVTIDIEIWGDLHNEELVNLVNSIRFTVPDTGNVEAPYAWEGEPISVEPMETVIGSFTLRSCQLPFSESITTMETFDHSIALKGSDAYISNDGAVRRYSFDGSAFTFITGLDFGEEYLYIDPADDGSFWLSDFMSPLLKWDGTQVVAAYGTSDQISMHPSGNWGIGWFADNTVQKVSLTADTASSEEYVLEELSGISCLSVDGKGNIFVAGHAADDSGHKVYVYDELFNLKTVLTDEDGTGLGSVTFMAETDNGYIILDGNMRWVVLYDKDGTWIGNCSDSDIFGTDYPWFCDAQMTDDGSIICIMTDERPDGSSDELIAFRLSGF